MFEEKHKLGASTFQNYKESGGENFFFSFSLGFEREKRLSLNKGGKFFENVGLSGPILWKKKNMCFYCIYIIFILRI